ncbi:hemagglutinin, partial [Pseudomonas sp. MWU13-2625]
SAAAYGDASVAQGAGAVAGLSGTPAVSGDVALGGGAQATGGNSLALGNGASVATLGGVALGAGSVATRLAGSYVDPISGSSFTTTFGAVSVGASGTLRQITNVAPGTQLTDAVNLGQLESAIGTLNQTINNLPTSTIGPSAGGGQTWITGNPATYTPPSAS